MRRHRYRTGDFYRYGDQFRFTIGAHGLYSSIVVRSSADFDTVVAWAGQLLAVALTSVGTPRRLVSGAELTRALWDTMLDTTPGERIDIVHANQLMTTSEVAPFRGIRHSLTYEALVGGFSFELMKHYMQLHQYERFLSQTTAETTIASLLGSRRWGVGAGRFMNATVGIATFDLRPKPRSWRRVRTVPERFSLVQVPDTHQPLTGRVLWGFWDARFSNS